MLKHVKPGRIYLICKYNDVANIIYHVEAPGKLFLRGYGSLLEGVIAARQAKIDSFKKANPPLLSYDKTLFNEYIEMVRSRFLYLKVQDADTLRRRAGEFRLIC